VVAPNAKKLLEKRRHLTVRCTISKLCLDKARIVEFLEDFGFTRIALNKCIEKPNVRGEYDIGQQENAALAVQDRILIERLFGNLKAGLPIRYNPYIKMLQDIHRAGPTTASIRCGVARGCTIVGVDGGLYPCQRYQGMTKYVYGDIWKGVHTEVLRDYFRKYFAVMKGCFACWAFKICGGPCPWYVSRDDGEIVPPGEVYCEDVKKNWLERSAWLYEILRTRFPKYLAEVVKTNYMDKISTGRPDIIPKPQSVAASASPTQRV
jgi:uncharacterized protein